ncbi:ImmA/IrrE family metallo-endopeptidase [Komagataeibacter europaeus]|uniref:ImmA/IrrE family metallo-endopeptidase n=1 Tax=Komagataeibacter europaeus TaxID=33995 RepID=UPI0015F87B42|nr:ImmA/IrrE family metallo-endopeptidase [Komagataeibacter europaeus]
MISQISIAELSDVFGNESRGDTPLERAKSSSQIYVRSQTQIANYKPSAKGLQLSAEQALRAFGYSTLKEVAWNGSSQLIYDRNEPAQTISNRRKELGLSTEQVAKAAALNKDDVIKAEKVGVISPIRHLQRIAEALALDEQVISFVSGAKGDTELGVRLRTLSRPKSAARLSPTIVRQLTEAAWVTMRQLTLAQMLGDEPELGINKMPSDDYDPPVWKRGYDLAAETRRLLGISEEKPILNIRELINKLGIPLIQAEIGKQFAGATVANGDGRGIVVNVQGSNQNVWVRRMTLCHELGHLLWEPADRLGKVKVDTYDELSGNFADCVESRANAFAIAFLAPPRAVSHLIHACGTEVEMVSNVMTHFGIGGAAARHHVANVCREFGPNSIDTTRVQNWQLPQPSNEWLVREDSINDFYPIKSVPITRRGRFAAYAVRAAEQGIVSFDTVATWLRTDIDELKRNVNNIKELSQ